MLSTPTITHEQDGAIATLTLFNPPVNLIDGPMLMHLDTLTKKLAADDQIRVVVLQSADPEFFAAHIDFALLDRVKQVHERQSELSLFHAINERFRTMPKVTIAKIRGRARGAGSELALGFDLRIAGRSAILGQPEILLGAPPGGGAITRLARLIGRGRALEAILTGRDYSADEAARIGWINAVIVEEALDAYVDALAKDLASRSRRAIVIAKAAFNAVEEMDTVTGLKEEWFHFAEALRTDESRLLVTRFLANGGQAPDAERNLHQTARASEISSAS